MISISPRLSKVFKNANVDYAVVVNTAAHDSNFIYLTGIYGGSFEGAVVVASRKRAKLLASILDCGVVKKNHPKEMDVICITKRDQVLKELKRLKGKRVGISGEFLPYNSYARLKKNAKPKKIVDISRNFASARQIKEWSEIELIGIANNIVKKAFSKIEGHFHDGVTEKELAKEFNALMMSYGASAPSFETIVCFGRNAAVPHHIPDSTKLERNSFVLIDAGARYMGYCSDVTRTFIFKPDRKSSKYKRMIMVYDTVKNAQKAAFDMVKEGVYADKVHKTASRYIDSAHNGIYKGKFIHALGHSIGIDVHDGPGFSPTEHYRLKEGMVISNEPGIYLEGFGGVRIEDDVLVTKKGARYL